MDTQSANIRQDRVFLCAFCTGLGARGTPDAGQEKCETGREESTLRSNTIFPIRRRPEGCFPQVLHVLL